MNALFIFALSGFLAKMFGYIKLAQPDGSLRSLGKTLYAPLAALPFGAVNTSLLHALLFDACMFALAWAMWRKRWFVKV
jgi:predicted acyltransferase